MGSVELAARRVIVGVASWFGTVRARAAVTSVVIVGVAFALAALGVMSLLRGSLYQSATNTARAEAMAIASVMSNKSSTHRFLPISEEEMAAQVVGPGGTVERSSRDVAGQAAMADLFPRPGSSASKSGVVLKVRRFTHVHLDLDDRYVVVAEGYANGRGRGAVLVAYSLGAADHAIALVEVSLAVALPLLALLVGVLVWALTGWALRPMEAIRREVAELSAKDLRRRVPEPAVADEVGRLARTMNAMLARLEASSDRQRQLVADVSHELRNPLAALRAQLEVAAEHPGGAAGMLAGSVAEVDRLSQLVEDLLTLARLDEGVLRLRLSDVDLDELVFTEAARLHAGPAGGLEVSLREVGAARVKGDEAHLARVVRNLADNAVRYARRRVSFSLCREGDQWELAVCDDGPGVPPAERERIFERFVRLDSARSHEGSGAGLGLAIVREIVAAHGGTVYVQDASGRRDPEAGGFGACFVVRLPVAEDASAGGEVPAFDGRLPAPS